MPVPDDRPCVLLAPDKFKGTLRAAEVAAALARGIHRTAPGARILTFARLNSDRGDVPGCVLIALMTGA